MPTHERPALQAVLDHYEIDYREHQQGNQKFRCPDPNHEDRDASASLNLKTELWQCFACGARGDSITLITLMEGCSVAEAFALGTAFGAGGSGRGVRRASAFGGGVAGGAGYQPRYRRKVPSGSGSGSPFR